MKAFLTLLPNEIWIKISDILIESGELRYMVNLHKILNLPLDLSKFQKELIKNRESKCIDYNEHMIKLWNKTGIDDGVPSYYLKEYLNENTKLFKTIWAKIVCGNEFYDVLSCNQNYHNKYVKYTFDIFEDDRMYFKNESNYKRGLCEKCVYKYLNQFKSQYEFYEDSYTILFK